MSGECEVYVLNDGLYQCGNCGEVFEVMGDNCPGCGASIVSVVEEGESDETEVGGW